MRFSYPQTAEGYLVLDGYTQLSGMNIDAGHRRITGWVNNARWTPAKFRNYFVLEFDQPFVGYGTWENEKNTILTDSTHKEGKGAGAWLKFAKGAVVQVKIASSYISPEQAITTLKRELGQYAGFDDTRQAAQQVWNKLFHRVLVEGGTEEQKATFYSCLFRANLFRISSSNTTNRVNLFITVLMTAPSTMAICILTMVSGILFARSSRLIPFCIQLWKAVKYAGPAGGTAAMRLAARLVVSFRNGWYAG